MEDSEKQPGYRTLKGAGQGNYRERGSKFLGYAFPVSAPGDFQERLSALREEHPKAHHHCYAYRLGADGETFRANDDGEPGGSAGRPILGQIDSLGLVNVGVVVVRYFGGVKLGIPGLIRAYRAAAGAALEDAPIGREIPSSRYRLTFGYSHLGAVMSALERMGIPLDRSHMERQVDLEIVLPTHRAEAVMLELRARIAGVSQNEARESPGPEGVTITCVSSSG